MVKCLSQIDEYLHSHICTHVKASHGSTSFNPGLGLEWYESGGQRTVILDDYWLMNASEMSNSGTVRDPSSQK